MKQTRAFFSFALILLSLYSPNLSAADLYWVATSGNWGDASNWATTSGGAGGAGLPGSSDRAIFDANSGNANVNVAFTIGDLQMDALYSGTVDASVTNPALQIKKDFELLGGTFVSTSGELLLRGNLNYEATFDHNNGTLRILHSTTGIGDNQVLGNPIDLWNLTFSAGAASRTEILCDTLTVSGELELRGNNRILLQGGVIHARGDVDAIGNYSASGTAGSTIILMDETGMQTINGGSSSKTKGLLPHLRIDKPANTLNIVGEVGVTTALENMGTTNPIVTGNGHILSFGVQASSYGAGQVKGPLETDHFFVFALGNTSVNFNNTTVVTGDLTIASRYLIRMDDGTIEVKGDILANNKFGSSSYVGNALIHINGTGLQTWSGGTTSNTQGHLPHVKVTKGAGELAIEGIVGVMGSLENTGSVNPVIPGGSGTLVVRAMSHGMGAVSLKGPFTLPNIRVLPTANCMLDLAGTTLTSTNELWFESGYLIRWDNGTFEGQGDIHARNAFSSTSTSVGNGKLLISGSAPEQLLVGRGQARIGRIPGLIVDKLVGEVLVDDFTTIDGSIELLSGVIKPVNPLDANDVLAVDMHASMVAASAASHVEGPMIKYGTDPFEFPLGANGRYLPLSISGPASLSGYRAEFVPAAPSAGSTSLAALSTCEHWDFSRESGTSDVELSLSWDSGSCLAPSPGDARVAEFDGAVWVDLGNSASSGGAAGGSVTSLTMATSYGQYALGSSVVPNPPPAVAGAGQLKRKLDGGYALSRNCEMSFFFEEDYQNEGLLDYAVLNEAGASVLGPSNQPLAASYGRNAYTIDLAGFGNGFYLLKVANAKGEVSQMRFLHDSAGCSAP